MMHSDNDKLNRNIGYFCGGFVLLASLIVYLRTVAPTVSYWDCGEFIACSFNLGIMHPPGSPLYLLIGRIMTMLPFFKDIGLRLNLFSPLISSATVLLAFLIILQLIRRWRGEAQTWEDRWILYGSGILGALALAFTDSFWFNAVEAEVYNFSLFFTALVVWLALHWGERSEKAGSLLLIIFIFYLFGLAAAVHLLAILAFPFVLFVAFFHDNQTVRRLLLLLTVQAAVPITLYILIFQFDPDALGMRMYEHQEKAWQFLKWFGTLWLAGSLIYMYIKDRKVFKIWWVLPLIVLIGYSTYFAIYIRANLHPPINMNNPSTLQAMSDYLSRKQYGQESLLLTFLHRKADFWNYQVQQMYTRYFGWQFIGKGVILDYRDRIVEIISLRGLYALPFLVGLWGAVHHFFRDWKRAVSILVLFLLTGYAIIIYINQPDPQPRERDYSYVGSFFTFALWIGIGAAGVFEWISEALKDRERLKKPIYGLAGVLLLIAVPLNLIAFNFESHDRSGNYVPWDYSYNILQTCEPDAILFTGGDNDTYPLWYLQKVEGLRKDVRVVCLSLLNAPWYIEQIRDKEPKVPIGLTDAAVENMRPMAWETREVGIAVPKDARERAVKELNSLDERMDEADVPDTMLFTLKPTFPAGNPQGLRMQDLMILRILQVNQWQRPIYFASTVGAVDRIGLDQYLRLDGLAHKLVPYIVKDVHQEILRTNLLEKFQYRNLDDPDVNYDVGSMSLFLNVRQSFLLLARHYLSRGQKEEAASVLEEMSKRIPEETIPYSNTLFGLEVAKHFYWAGLEPDYVTMSEKVISGRQVSARELKDIANQYMYFKDWTRAEEAYLKVLADNPGEVDATSMLIYLYKASEQYDKGIRLLEEWLLRRPNDNGAKRELETFRDFAAQKTDS